MNNRFNHLHLHTAEGSLLDGYCRTPDLIKRVKELGMSAVACTDHGVLLNIPIFQAECKKQNVKPLIGMEGYFSPDCSQLTAPVEERHKRAEEIAVASGEYTDKVIRNLKGEEKKKFYKKWSYDTTGYHILFLAKDQQGWNNLVKLQSEAARLGTFNGRFHCDYNLLEKYHEGLICLTACIASYSSRKICSGQESEAIKYLDFMKDLFGADFFLEIQPLTDEDDRQIQTNLFYLNYAVDNNLPMIATNDVHWVRQEDYTAHEILTCIGTGYKMSDENRMKYDPVFWLRSEEEMLEAFNLQMNTAIDRDYLLEEEAPIYQEAYIGAINNTGYIADLIDPDIRLGSDKPLFTTVQIPGKTSEEILREKAEAGLQKYLSEHPTFDPDQYQGQLNYELDIINKKGFAPYFLTVDEYVSWCGDNDIITGPGRGSAAASLVLLSLGITRGVDPIQDKLIFERFLSEDRVEFPDIDQDISWLNRDKVIQHLKDLYGQQCVSHIGTVTALKVKSAIKDVCRVLGVDFKSSLQISKVIDSLETDPNLSFKMIDSWKEEAPDKWQQIQELEEKYPEVFKYARLFEGIPRQMGVHASGILVTPIPVSDVTPIRYVDGVAITLYSGPEIEHQGMIKYDLLGLKTLDIIALTCKEIGIILEELYQRVNRDDPNIYKMIQDRKTDCIFQIESDLMRKVADQFVPTGFDDLSAIIACCRPGPLSAGADKIYAHGKKTGSFENPLRGCEEIFGRTHGAIIYQEQTMQVSQVVAGFTGTQADSIVRKCFAKKKLSMMPMLIRCHIYGKKNCEGPEGWEDNSELPWYDPKGKYGPEIEGALSRGYTAEEIYDYFHKIEAFTSYGFNLGHSAAYAYIAVLTAWLKYYYPVEFMAANLTVFSEDEERRAKYTNLCENQMHIKILPPDINLSGSDFTPHAIDKTILYGLGSVRGCGSSSVPIIIAERKDGYKSIEDTINRLPKKIFSKTVGDNLIKSGAFDSLEENRYKLLNQFHALRKDKGVEIYDEDKYTDEVKLEFEEYTLGTGVSTRRWWSTIGVDEKILEVQAKLTNKSVRQDRYGGTILFFDATIGNSKVPCIMFNRIYKKFGSTAEQAEMAILSGKKDSKGTFIIESVIIPKKSTEE